MNDGNGNDPAAVLLSVCDALSAGDARGAKAQITTNYPYRPMEKSPRKYGDQLALEVFCRDGFIDRYSGCRLVFPGTLKLLSMLMPEEFPRHSNWKMSETHPAFWELSPTLDHVIPAAQGGPDLPENLVTTSMLRNSAKANWTLEDLGWSLYPAGSLADWNGLLSWFVDFVGANPGYLEDTYVRKWFNASKAITAASK